MQPNDGLLAAMAGGQQNRRRFLTGISFLDPNPYGEKLVLLLHGLGANSLSWGYQTAALVEAGFRPLAVDMPGFGESPAPARKRWSLELAAGQIAGLLEALNVGPAHVVGLSLGGVVAQTLALRHPGRVDRLVLVNTFACLRPKNAGEWMYLTRRFIVANLRGHSAQADRVAWRIFPRVEQSELRALLAAAIRSTDPNVYRSAMRALAFHDTRDRLKSLRMSTLVVSGSADTTVGMAVQDELARLIPGARRVIIPAAGHAAPVDQPGPFNQALLNFLTG